MGGCRCTYKNCKSATKNTENQHFFHFPVKNPDRCLKWIQNAGRPEFLELSDEKLINKVICSNHFEEKCFTNVQRRRLVQDAVPTLDVGCDPIDPDTKDVHIFPTSSDGSTFMLQSNHLPGSSRKVDVQVGNDYSGEVYIIDPKYIEDRFYNTQNVITDGAIIYKADGLDVKEEPEYDPPKEVEINIPPPPVKIDKKIIQSTTAIITPNPGKRKLLSKINVILPPSDPKPEPIKTHPTPQAPPPPPARPIKIIEIDTEPEPAIKRKSERLGANGNETNEPVRRVKTKVTIKHRNLKRYNYILKMLKGQIPETLLGALSLHLFKRRTNLRAEEKSFLHALKAISPSAYVTLKDFGWCIPEHNFANGTVQTKE